MARAARSSWIPSRRIRERRREGSACRRAEPASCAAARGAVERDVARLRRHGRATRPAVDSGRVHAGDELAVEAGVARRHGAIALGEERIVGIDGGWDGIHASTLARARRHRLAEIRHDRGPSRAPATARTDAVASPCVASGIDWSHDSPVRPRCLRRTRQERCLGGRQRQPGPRLRHRADSAARRDAAGALRRSLPRREGAEPGGRRREVGSRYHLHRRARPRRAGRAARGHDRGCRHRRPARASRRRRDRPGLHRREPGGGEHDHRGGRREPRCGLAHAGRSRRAGRVIRAPHATRAADVRRERGRGRRARGRHPRDAERRARPGAAGGAAANARLSHRERARGLASSAVPRTSRSPR